jgi:tripartite ATP-independent transporter DctP family solute receptor
MKKGLVLAGTLTALTLAVTGCGDKPANSGNSTTSKSDEKPASTATPANSSSGKTNALEIKIAHHLSPQSVQNAGLEKFKEIVEKEAKGQIKVSIFPAGQLGSQADLLKQVKSGSLQMSLGESGAFANYDKELGVLALPFLFSDYEQYHKVVDGEIGQRLNKKLVDVGGMRTIAFYDGGIRDIYSSKKPVKTIDDLKGMKIRTPQSPIFIDTFKALGANPTPVAAGDIYTSMQTGLVDSMEGTTETGWTFKIHEVGKYISRTRHINTDVQLAVNEKWLQSLPAEQRDLILKAAKDSEKFQRDEWKKKEQEFLDKLKGEGKMEVVDTDLKPFKDGVADVYKKFKEETKSDILDKIQEQTK